MVAPGRSFSSNDVGAEVLDDAVVLDGLHPVGAAEGDLVDEMRGGVRHVDAPRGDDEEGIAVLAEGREAFAVGPNGVDDARRWALAKDERKYT